VKKSIIILVFLLLAPAMGSARQKYPEVAAHGNKQPFLAIAQPLSLGGKQDTRIAGEIEEVMKFDLNLADCVKVMTASTKENKDGIRPGDIDFTQWRTTGVALLVKTGYVIDGEKIMTEFRLYNVKSEKQLWSEVFTGKRRFVRKMAHAFVDDILRVVTGDEGPFAGQIVFVSARTGNKEVYVMDYDGYNVRQITRNGSINLNPSFSPDGRDIIYTSYKKGNPDLYLSKVYSDSDTLISSRPGLNVTAAWAPHGNRIALAMSMDGDSQIYLINDRGKILARLTSDDAIDISPSWSPNGSQITFVSDREGTPQVFIMNADGSKVRKLTTSGDYNVGPSWSPRGDRILYCRRESNDFQIHEIKPDGTDDIRLTSEGRNEYPHWSPDGRFVTFTSNRDGKEAIYVMRADGTSQFKVSRGTGGDSRSVWSQHP
jgi:TolB protein